MLTATEFFSRFPGQITPFDEAEFFGGLKTGNATFKKTADGRFADVDAALVEALAVKRATIDEVLDIGISSGITALDLHGALSKAGYQVRITGTDRSFEAYIVSVLPGCRVLIEAHGHALQYELFGWPLRPWRRRLDYIDGMFLVRSLLDRLFLHRARRILAQAGDRARRVELISPRLKGHEAIKIVEDDICEHNRAFAGRFDLVRVANILNRDYFDEPTLRRALFHLGSYLAGPGAWLLILRTHGRAEHHGTLFRVGDDGGLDPVNRVGRGSEIEELAISCIDCRPHSRF